MTDISQNEDCSETALADRLISTGVERVRIEALRRLLAFDIEDDHATMPPLPVVLPGAG